MANYNRVIDGFKVCSVCDESKPVDEFYLMKDRGIYHSHCNPCRLSKGTRYRKANPLKYREGWLKTTYGLTLDAYNKMFADQGGKCKCCQTHQSELEHTLHVDHCHASEEIRGLLCKQCNTALGQVKDNTETLKRMIEYLNGQ